MAPFYCLRGRLAGPPPECEPRSPRIRGREHGGSPSVQGAGHLGSLPAGDLITCRPRRARRYRRQGLASERHEAEGMPDRVAEHPEAPSPARQRVVPLAAGRPG